MRLVSPAYSYLLLIRTVHRRPCGSEMRVPLLRMRPVTLWLDAGQRSPLSAAARPSRQLNRAARSAIRRDSCDDVRRRIREEGRSAMWRVIRSSVGSKGDGRIVPVASPDQMSRFFVGVGPRVADEMRDMPAL